MPLASPLAAVPPRDCPHCPRLVGLREALRDEHPDWWNAPVPAFGDPDAWLGIVGMAPGMRGANRTGRPFTGDVAGDLLFETLGRFDLAHGTYDRRADDGVRLDGAIILNVVKCLPPQNKPTPAEIDNCRRFLGSELAALGNARILIALGGIAHRSLVKALGGKQAQAKFGHLAEHRMPCGRILLDSYHCSRYNTNTGRLTPAMFDAVFARAIALRAALSPA